MPPDANRHGRQERRERQSEVAAATAITA